LLFVNDRIDVALACEADGVQLGEEGLPVEVARWVSRSRLLLGRSVHGVGGAETAEAEDADILVVGAVFPTGSHPGTVSQGVELLEGVRSRTRIPFLAIGGVNASNVQAVIEAGASGTAVISAIMRSDDPTRASALLAQRMRDGMASAAEKDR
jgi:thiamine-phosphate pyrophosphorylase